MSPRISELFFAGSRFLKERGFEDSTESCELLLSHTLECPRHSLYLNFKGTISEKAQNRFFDLLKKRATHFPVQYLTGQVYFRHLDLEIKSGVFIPRPETEGLVDVVLSRISEINLKRPRILDIGTGTGCVAISLASEISGATVVATDRSVRAVRLAKRNAVRNGAGRHVQFFHTNYWDGISGKFDCVAANPPYLTRVELCTLQPEVNFEPKLALAGGVDGLEAYRFITKSVGDILKPGGFIAFEIGLGQAEPLSEMLEENHFFDIRKTKDFAGIERVISARLAGSNG